MSFLAKVETARLKYKNYSLLQVSRELTSTNIRLKEENLTNEQREKCEVVKVVLEQLKKNKMKDEELSIKDRIIDNQDEMLSKKEDKIKKVKKKLMKVAKIAKKTLKENKDLRRGVSPSHCDTVNFFIKLSRKLKFPCPREIIEKNKERRDDYLKNEKPFINKVLKKDGKPIIKQKTQKDLKQ